MYEQISNGGSATGIGFTRENILAARANKQRGYYFNAPQTSSIVLENESTNPLNAQYSTQSDKIKYIRGLHNQFMKQGMGNRLGLLNQLPYGTQRIPMYERGNGYQGNQLENLGEYMDKFLPYNKSRYTTEAAKNIAKSILTGFNLNGLIPGRKATNTDMIREKQIGNLIDLNTIDFSEKNMLNRIDQLDKMDEMDKVDEMDKAGEKLDYEQDWADFSLP